MKSEEVTNGEDMTMTQDVRLTSNPDGSDTGRSIPVRFHLCIKSIPADESTSSEITPEQKVEDAQSVLGVFELAFARSFDKKHIVTVPSADGTTIAEADPPVSVKLAGSPVQLSWSARVYPTDRPCK